MPPRLVLASASPQRSLLLRQLGWEFDVVPSEVDEDAHGVTQPAARARELARMKALDVASRYPDRPVIGGDTLVEAPDGTLLEKARDADDARRMILLLRGRTCHVHSGVCVALRGEARDGLCTSAVHFAPLTDAQVDWWIGTGLWRNRSGSFQIDGPGQLMIERLEGDWTGVVGLPVFLLGELLRAAGVADA